MKLLSFTASQKLGKDISWVKSTYLIGRRCFHSFSRRGTTASGDCNNNCIIKLGYIQIQEIDTERYLTSVKFMM
jgi:hypothetical protein